MHVLRAHKGIKALCDSCESVFDSKDELNNHIEFFHGESQSPVAKKQKQNPEVVAVGEYSDEIEDKLQVLETISWEEERLNHRVIETKVSEDEHELMKEYNEEERKIEVNRTMEEMNDEKVLLKQKAWFDEEVRYQEMKRHYSEKLDKEEHTKKRQRSNVNKKKSKSKKTVNAEKIDLKKKSPFIEDIPKEYEKVFKDVGLDVNNYKIYKVKGDGACASNCVAVHCHGQESLGPYVRRNMNNFEAEFFPLFRPFYTWPHIQMVGSKSITFENEFEYIEFLKNDSRSGILWMDHQGLQIVSNAYQIEIHILTIKLRGSS